MRTYEDLSDIRCPACSKILSSQKGIPAHCSRCKVWDDEVDIPYSDFIVLPPSIEPHNIPSDFLDTFTPTKVVEAFGTYWHGPEVTGLPRDEHEAQLVDAYRQEGVDCLVLWEDQSDEWSCRLGSFIGS